MTERTTRIEKPRTPTPRGASRTRLKAPPLLSSDCALFLDIDGTLLDLASTPDRVVVDDEILAELDSLARALQGAVALVTGRAIRDADKLFHGLRFPIAGQHGFERRAADGSLHQYAPQSASLLQLRTELTRLAARHPGLILEDKGATLALHYRLVPRLAAHVHRIVRAEIARLAAEGSNLSLQRGKRIVEILPDGMDKGTAILEYMKEPPFRGRLPVFIGDDVTDELGFAAVERLGGWAIKVGAGPTRARYRLPHVAAVRRWLSGVPLQSR